MLRQATSRTVRSSSSLLSSVQPRTFTTVAARLAAGDTGSGSSRPMGQAQGYVCITNSTAIQYIKSRAFPHGNWFSFHELRALTISYHHNIIATHFQSEKRRRKTCGSRKTSAKSTYSDLLHMTSPRQMCLMNSFSAIRINTQMLSCVGTGS